MAAPEGTESVNNQRGSDRRMDAYFFFFLTS